MAEDRKDITLDGNTAVWDMRLEGEIAGTYAGTFKFRCFLTPVEKISANREMREILGPQMTMAGEHEANLAFALTQLKYRVLQAPPFWNTGGILQGNISDSGVVLQVLDAAIDAELKYMKNLKAKKLEAIERAKKAAEEMLNNSLDDGDYVDEEEQQK